MAANNGESRIITVSNVAELEKAVREANESGNVTLILENGTYNIQEGKDIGAGIVIRGDHITIRSKSGNRDDVIIRGHGMEADGPVTHIFSVYGKNFTAQDMTIGWVRQHAIQIHGECEADNAVMRNLHIIDASEQMIKVSYDDRSPASAKNGLLEDCLIEFSQKMGQQYYTGGIDAHQSKDWVVRNNIFKGIRSPNSKKMADPTIFFWSFSENTLVENNIIIDCDRGIGLGLMHRGHIGGIVRNNMVLTSRSVGIGLENSRGSQVYNNTVYTLNYPNSIECRFEGTYDVVVTNNLTNGRIVERDGGSAKFIDNVDSAEAEWFKDIKNGDLHLVVPESTVVPQGKPMPGVKSK